MLRNVSLIAALCLASSAPAMAESITGRVYQDGKLVARLAATYSEQGDTREITVKTKDLNDKVVSSRRSVTKNGELQLLEFSFPDKKLTSSSTRQGDKFQIKRNDELTDTVDFDPAVTSFDLMPWLIDQHRVALQAEETVTLKMLSPLRAEVMNFELRQLGSAKFEGQDAMSFEMQPAGFFMSMMSSMFSIKPRIYQDPKTKRILGLNGPVMGLPGHDPTGSGPPPMAVTVWDPPTAPAKSEP